MCLMCITVSLLEILNSQIRKKIQEFTYHWLSNTINQVKNDKRQTIVVSFFNSRLLLLFHMQPIVNKAACPSTEADRRSGVDLDSGAERESNTERSYEIFCQSLNSFLKDYFPLELITPPRFPAPFLAARRCSTSLFSK